MALLDRSCGVCPIVGDERELVTVLVGCLPPLMAGLICEALAIDRRFHVIGGDTTGTSLEREVRLTAPHVVVVGDEIAYEQTRRIRATEKAPAVVVVTGQRAGLVGPLLAADGMASVTEDAGGSQLRTAVYLAASAREDGLWAEIAELTARELEVLRCLSRGLTNPQIAATLHIGTATVQSHVSRIFDKFGPRNRREYIGLRVPAATPSDPGIGNTK